MREDDGQMTDGLTDTGERRVVTEAYKTQSEFTGSLVGDGMVGRRDFQTTSPQTAQGEPLSAGASRDAPRPQRVLTATASAEGQSEC